MAQSSLFNVNSKTGGGTPFCDAVGDGSSEEGGLTGFDDVRSDPRNVDCLVANVDGPDDDETDVKETDVDEIDVDEADTEDDDVEEDNMDVADVIDVADVEENGSEETGVEEIGSDEASTTELLEELGCLCSSVWRYMFTEEGGFEGGSGRAASHISVLNELMGFPL
ncbi:MAG: hypothetical protein M1820_008354 [Bogoriella megaspora]|nr:MAG: hypothetical protein M1820_008354 [Bogoriella megaspora]